MSCLWPRVLYRRGSEVSSRELPDSSAFHVPCGGCVECRAARGREWGVRAAHEASMYAESSFVTLTYDDEHVPVSLDPGCLQRFLKRVRKRVAFRYLAAGEYGDRFGRPHYHVLLFGVAPSFPVGRYWSVGSVDVKPLTVGG